MTEFDYVQEAKQMNRVRKNLLKCDGGLLNPNIHISVPEAFTDLCTHRVLVMEELEGEKLADALRKDMERHAKRKGMTLEEFEKEEMLKLRKLKQEGSVSINGPSSEEYERYIRLLNSKRKLSNAAALVHNWTLGFLPGFQYRPYESRSTLPINHAKVIDDLIYIHGHEVGNINYCFILCFVNLLNVRGASSLIEKNYKNLTLPLVSPLRVGPSRWLFQW